MFEPSPPSLYIISLKLNSLSLISRRQNSDPSFLKKVVNHSLVLRFLYVTVSNFKSCKVQNDSDVVRDKNGEENSGKGLVRVSKIDSITRGWKPHLLQVLYSLDPFSF
ncbi:hypothetical protein L1887_01510 [Cichorium endivia]|nr:hypothetical protein L1887_01510 [Cichorium endivia]